MSDEFVSPLAEAAPDSIDLLLDRITDHLAAGVPEKIKSEAIFERMIAGFRAQAEKWNSDELAAKPHRGGGRKTNSPAKINLEGLI